MLRPYKEKLDFGELRAFERGGYRRIHQQFRKVLGGVIQFVDALANEFVFAASHGFLQRGDACFNFSALFGRQARGLRIGERLGGGGQDRFGFRARFDHLALGEILLRVFDGFLEHALDFGIVDAVARLDLDGMLLAGAEIFGANLEDAVGVDQEFHFDARQSGGRGRHAQREARKRAAVFRQFALTLKDVDVDAGLIVDAGGVLFLRARGNGGIARDDFCNGAAVGLDAEGERGDVEQQHIFYALVENVGLDGGAERDDFVGVQLDVRLAIEKLLHGAADERRARGAADEHDFVHVCGLKLRVRKRLLDGPHGAVNHGANEGIDCAAREFVNEQFAVRQREAKRGGLQFGKLMLYFDQRFAKLLGQFAMRRKIELVVLENLFVDESLQQIIDVVAAEVRVAIGGKNLEDIALGRGNELEDGNVKRAATEIVDGNFAALLLVKAVGERRGGGLVDEAENFKAGDFAGVLGGLALGVVEIGRHGDHRAIDDFAEMGFGPVFQFAQDESGNLRRGENFFAEHHADDVFARGIDTKRKELEFALNVGGASAHEALHGIDGALWLREQAADGSLANDDASVGI